MGVGGDFCGFSVGHVDCSLFSVLLHWRFFIVGFRFVLGLVLVVFLVFGVWVLGVWCCLWFVCLGFLDGIIV